MATVVVAATAEAEAATVAATEVVAVTVETAADVEKYFSDLAALFVLWRRMRAGRFAIVHSFAPKAGLLAMTAAWLARVPNRLHTFQGEVWVTRRGLMRHLLKAADRLMARLATHVLVVGEGEREFLIREGVLCKESEVLAKGSIGGVDVVRFRPDPAARMRIRTARLLHSARRPT